MYCVFVRIKKFGIDKELEKIRELYALKNMKLKDTDDSK